MRQLEHRRPSWLLDGVIVLLILAAWLPVAWYLTGGLGIVWYDTFRDMAWAENMRAGRIWADPVVAGQTWWYAPGGPLLAAAVARLTGWPVAEVYAASPAWCNGWIPAALYVLARVAWGRGTALLALATVLLGSYWWYTHVAAPIPGIQAVTLMLLVLLGWHLSVTAGRAYTWAAISGVLLALTTWYHPMCGILPAFTIALQVLYDALRPRKCRQRLLGRMLVVAGTALVLTCRSLCTWSRSTPKIRDCCNTWRRKLRARRFMRMPIPRWSSPPFSWGCGSSCDTRPRHFGRWPIYLPRCCCKFRLTWRVIWT